MIVVPLSSKVLIAHMAAMRTFHLNGRHAQQQVASVATGTVCQISYPFLYRCYDGSARRTWTMPFHEVLRVGVGECCTNDPGKGGMHPGYRKPDDFAKQESGE
ncbi:hypothetical protein N2599_08130 [Rhizobium sullae]|uniref:Uncharacterized protein n=1 Tax=Rhizobium sullae TaxID=50338 RepID=A0ABY5XMV8_RHISU|nr:hypothetical protein [Rhizobium sullae]UWU15950.1 hypothetical protein N2599_08130 [Rhizobium sullae]